MTQEPVVAVRGEVIREVEPELARFSVTVSARGKDRAGALARLRERASAVRGMLDGFGDAVERREDGGLHVQPETRRRGETVIAYQGSLTTTVTVGDFSILGEMMLRLADQDQTQVHGPWWALRADSPVYREARRSAVGEAIARAREYADALGARVVRLIEVADSGQPGDQPITFGQPGRMALTEAEPQLVLDPQRQTVRAEIHARFAISEPTVLHTADTQAP